MAFRSGVLELLDEDACRQALSPINVDEGSAYFFPETQAPSPRQLPCSSPPIISSPSRAASIAAIAKEFQESKLSEFMGLISNSVPVVLVTGQQWDYVPLMIDGMHYIYEGCLLDVQGEKNNRSFIMRLKYPNRKAPILIQFTSNEVISLLPRHAQRSRPEECSYFHMHGHCAFGLKCHKSHDPRKLSEKVKECLKCGDISILNENQQHTLHIAMVEDGIDEAEMKSEFEPFGAVKSVKIETGKALLQGQGLRIGFVTFHNAKDAIKAKKVLNDDPKSKFRGVIQATKIHTPTTAPLSQEKELTLPRHIVHTRLDRPTEQLYLHCLFDNAGATAHEVQSLLEENSLTSYLDISIGPNGTYALVLFDCIEDSRTACLTLLSCRPRRWAVDYQPVDDRAHFKIRYLRWLALRRKEADHIKCVGKFWNSKKPLTQEMKADQEDLYDLLRIMRRQIREADDQLTKLVIQALQQADYQMKREGVPMDIVLFASAIGPDAVAYAEEKSGSIRDFMECHWQTALFPVQESPQPAISFANKEDEGPSSDSDRSKSQKIPDLYSYQLEHVKWARMMQPAAVLMAR